MPGPKKHSVELSDEQREQLRILVSTGEHKARVIRRGHILLMSEKGKTDEQIAEFLDITAQTVYLTRRKFVSGGLESALFDKPRPPKDKLFDAKKEANLIALTCSEPPEGREPWTIRLLTEKVIERGIVDDVSRETVRRTLKKTTSNRGKRKVGAFLK